MQEGCSFEIIVVDDCSTDNTEDMINAMNNNIISYYRLIKKRGPQFARNFGSEKAKFALLIFLDSDDLLLPGSLKTRLKYFESNPDCESSYSDYEVCFKGVKRDYKKKVIINKLTYKNVLTNLEVVPTSLLMIIKKVFFKIGKFDESFPACHDDDIYIRCFKRRTCHYIPIVAVEFINHSGHRVGTSYNLALGRTMILEKYSGEIINELGSKRLQKHYIKNGIDYLLLNDYTNFKKLWYKMKDYGKPLYYYFIKIIIERNILKISRKMRHLIFRFE